MKFVIGIALVASLGCAGCVGNKTTAQSGPATAPTKVSDATPVSDDPNDPIICRNEADSTTRIGKYKVCKHKSAWEKADDRAQRTMKDTQGVGINPYKSN